MVFDFSTLVTNRSSSDVAYVRQLVERFVSGTATDEDREAWNSIALKGAYNYTDLNRVNAAMSAINEMLVNAGYKPAYKKFSIPRPNYYDDVFLRVDSVIYGDDYDTYVFVAPGTGTFVCKAELDGVTKEKSITVSENIQYPVDLAIEQLVHYTMLYDGGDVDIPLLVRDTSIDTNGDGNNDSNCIKVTENKIDLSPYSQMVAFIVENTATLYMGAFSTNTLVTSYYNAPCKLAYASGYDFANKFAIADVSSINVEAYCSCGLFASWDGWATEYTETDGIFRATVSGRDRFLSFKSWFLTEPDDWQTLASKAEISASSMSDLIANAETLLSNKSAVEFMVYNCTGDFMVSALQSDTFLSALESSDNKNVVYENEHWAKFLNLLS